MFATLREVLGHVRLNVGCDSLRTIDGCIRFVRLAMLARAVKPRHIRNVTLWGTTGSAGSASVVFLSAGNDRPSDAIFRDLRTDAVLNGA